MEAALDQFPFGVRIAVFEAVGRRARVALEMPTPGEPILMQQNPEVCENLAYGQLN